MAALDDLERAYRQATRARYEAQEARSAFERTLREEFNARLARELEEKGYNARVTAANIAENEAKEALDRETERLAIEEKEHPYPLGTRMVEWEYDSRARFGAARPTDRRWTGRVGVLEVITDKSQHPANKTYGLAKRGELVIRVLKKDGTPSKNYERVGSYWAREHWVPEGTDLLQEDLSWPETPNKLDRK